MGVCMANTENFYSYLEKAAKFHGHACVGTAMGTKITLAALKALDLDPQQKTRDLIVYAEIDRCMTDSVQAITGCSLGRRSLKHVDYGKFAATFVNIATGKAVRATIKEDFPTKGPKEEVIQSIATTSYQDMVILQEVQIEIAETDLPGPPREKAVCAACGERVMDARSIIRNGATFCKACADGAYYNTTGNKG